MYSLTCKYIFFQYAKWIIVVFCSSMTKHNRGYGLTSFSHQNMHPQFKCNTPNVTSNMFLYNEWMNE